MATSNPALVNPRLLVWAREQSGYGLEPVASGKVERVLVWDLQPDGCVANEIRYRHDEPRLEIVESGRPWSFDGDGAPSSLAPEAHL